MRALTALGSDELSARSQEARRLLRDNGVVYNAYGDPKEQRPWLLDPIPLPIASEEWLTIERGLQQRAELFRRLLSDLYGSRELLSRRILPPELIYTHPGFLRCCDNIELASSQHRLPLYAADLARASDGSFYVLDDRTQVPPGAGYALENRIVLSRVLPSLFRDCRVHRLALYFRTLRNSLGKMAWRESDDSRTVVLTPGPSSEFFFEHAYLAKYLGYTLVEGADLAVRDGRVWLKTLAGLQPVDVILRYVDDNLCDPLELRADSSFGVAGLLQTARLQQVAIANPLGNGILENPALLAFLPSLAKHLLGEELSLPSPVSYWCGDAKHCQHVLANLDRMLIKPIVRSAESATIDTAQLSRSQREQLRQQILARPNFYVGQEPLQPSTTPVFIDNALHPRQMVLRSFLVAAEDDYVVMPGGLCRVAAGAEMPVESVQSGGISKDAWVLASEPVQPVSLLASLSDDTNFALHRGEMPSRVAENLFWLGRYAERSESIIRLLRVLFVYMLDPNKETLDNENDTCLHALLRAITQLTETYPGFIGEDAEQKLAEPDEELLAVLLDDTRIGSLSYNLNALLYAARSARDRISTDIWRVFNDIDEGLKLLQTPKEALQFSTADNEVLNSAVGELNTLLTTFAAFTGLAMDSMTHGEGWRFLMVGRRLERARQTLQLLHAVSLTADEDESRITECLLRVCDSLMTYRSRYRSQIHPHLMLELLLKDETNPRAVSYQLRHIQHDVEALPGMSSDVTYQRLEKRLILDGLSHLRLADSSSLIRVENNHRPQLKELLDHISERLLQLSDALSNSYFSHAEQPRQLIRFTPH